MTTPASRPLLSQSLDAPTDAPAGPSARAGRGALTRLVAPASVVLVGGALTGCAALSPMQIDRAYDTGVGQSVDLGPVEVRDLVVVSDGDGAPGALSGGVVNESAEPAELRIGAPTGEVVVSLQPWEVVQLGRSDAVIDQVDPIAGALLPLTLTTQASGATSVSVPVVAAEGLYAELGSDS